MTSRIALYTVYLFCLVIQVILAILEVPKFHVCLFLQVLLAIPDDLLLLQTHIHNYECANLLNCWFIFLFSSCYAAHCINQRYLKVYGNVWRTDGFCSPRVSRLLLLSIGMEIAFNPHLHMIYDFSSILHRGASSAEFSCSLYLLSCYMALFFKLWHYLEIQVFLGIQGHPWILVVQVALGYLVNPSLLGIHRVLKEKRKSSIYLFKVAHSSSHYKLTNIKVQ